MTRPSPARRARVACGSARVPAIFVVVARTTASDDDRPTDSAQRTHPSPGLAIAIAWVRGDHEQRVGELLMLPPGDRRTWVFGRGADAPRNAAWSRAALVRQRPGGVTPTGAFDVAILSREQIRFQAIDDDSLALENIGKRALFVGGVRTSQAVLRPGSTFRIDGVLIGLCVKRPLALPPSPPLASSPGPADELALIGESPGIWALRDALAFVRAQRGHVLLHGPMGSGVGRAALTIAGGDTPELNIAELDGAELLAALSHHEVAGRTALVVSGLEGSAESPARLLRLLGDEDVIVRTRRLKIRIVSRLEGEPGSLPAPGPGVFRHLVRVPGLAERREDVPLLAQHLADLALAENASLRARFGDARGHARLSAELVEQLLTAPLAGGARELSQLLWRALGASTGDVIEATTEEPTAGRPPPIEPQLTVDELPANNDEVVPRLALLTRTERLIMQHLALNRTSQQVARALFVSVRTVQNHRARICRKLELSGHHSLLAVALALKTALGAPTGG